jgi:hypothetical protein
VLKQQKDEVLQEFKEVLRSEAHDMLKSSLLKIQCKQQEGVKDLRSVCNEFESEMAD